MEPGHKTTFFRFEESGRAPVFYFLIFNFYLLI